MMPLLGLGDRKTMRETVVLENLDIYTRNQYCKLGLGRPARLPNFFTEINGRRVAVIETDDITDEDIRKIIETYNAHKK
jgi:hypothetical protein